MPQRLDVAKTFKMYIDGKFPRSESGRSFDVRAADRLIAHACLASRKDLRDAVEAARRAQEKWADATPYLRGQILYRIAEMLEGKRRELADLLAPPPRGRGPGSGSSPSARRQTAKPSLRPDAEVSASIDRLIAYAGWADKYAQILGCQNPAAGPYYNFTIPEPTGVVAAIAPDAPALLALVSLIAPVVVSGNTCVALASRANPLPACVFAEACASGDLPPGVLNILTGERAELLPHVAAHRDIDAVHAANLSSESAARLRAGAAENVKRVTVRSDLDWHDPACESPWWIEPFVEFKTIWHPSSV